MSQIVQTILNEAAKNKLVTVSRVKLSVGELTFLGEEALRFCYKVLTEDNILQKSQLIIETIKPEVKCKSCGYLGELEYLANDYYHFRLPKFTCPKCNGEVIIIEGKSCILQEITGDTE